MLFFIIDIILKKNEKKTINYNKMMVAITLHNIPEGMAVGVLYAGWVQGNALVSFSAAVSLCGADVKYEVYQDPSLVHDFPLFQCDRKEAGDAIRKICSFFWNCIWHEKNVKTIQVYPVQMH